MDLEVCCSFSSSVRQCVPGTVVLGIRFAAVSVRI